MPTLVVEKGHCYRTTGSTGTTGEQDFATAAAGAIHAHIHGRNGWQVAVKLADSGSYKGDAFVALHCDGSTNPTARGSSVGYQSGEGQWFGQQFKTAYAANGWTGGFRSDNYTDALAGYYGVRNAINAGNKTAIIIECGFLTNPDDRKLLTAPAGPDRVAYAVGDVLGIPSEDSMADSNDVQIANWRIHAIAYGFGETQGGPTNGETLPQVQHWYDMQQQVASLHTKMDALTEKLDKLTADAGTLIPQVDGELRVTYVPQPPTT